MTSLQNREILLTGATGFIGSHLTKKLVQSGASVTCLIRDEAKFARLADFIEITESSSNQSKGSLHCIKCDLADPKNLESVQDRLKGYDTLIHLATQISGAGDVVKNGPAQINIDLKSTIELIKAMTDMKCMCYLSSMAVFGATRSEPVTETTETNPDNVYGICKLTMEKLLKLFSEYENVPVTILRPSSVYGPGNTSARAIPTFINKILKNEPLIVFGDGEQLRDYIYVEDVVNAIVLALEHNKFDIFNIGAGKGCSINDLLKILSDIGKSAEPNIEYKSAPDSTITFDFVYDISKAKSILGFNPKTALHEGLSLEFEWRKNNLS
ncbi:MAG: SDR family NAD(P)-dependent oxidoreductase [Thermoplasmata archaeon]|nr:MAG: SDR family NAD(P)-dependent oxidoreductase [Thermoplasmata archaeon]